MKITNFKSVRESIVVDLKVNNGVISEFVFADSRLSDIKARLTHTVCYDEDRNWYYVSDDVFARYSNYIEYSYIKGCYYFKGVLTNPKEHSRKRSGVFPYHIDRDYAATTNLDLFQEAFAQSCGAGTAPDLKPIKHTFGIEYETSEGAIPQADCFRLGMIPLRDGSISGVEYASVVMNNNHHHIVKQQVQALNKFTNFDKDCAIHIHFGNIPIDCDFGFVVYTILCKMQDDIKELFHEYVFNTEKYKSSGKSYCQILKSPKPLTTTDAMYEFFSEGTPYFGTPYEAHPRDLSGQHKWQINRRYYWCNFINLMFYDKAKTIEFRLFRPTHNPNKVIGFIHLFSMILEWAETVYSEIKKSGMEFTKDSIESYKAKLDDLPGLTGRDYLVKFMNQMRETRKLMNESGDYYCSDNRYDNIVTELKK